jgi:hypothetical protein
MFELTLVHKEESQTFRFPTDIARDIEGATISLPATLHIERSMSSGRKHSTFTLERPMKTESDSMEDEIKPVLVKPTLAKPALVNLSQAKGRRVTRTPAQLCEELDKVLESVIDEIDSSGTADSAARLPKEPWVTSNGSRC